jgi:hypothetical protein
MTEDRRKEIVDLIETRNYRTAIELAESLSSTKDPMALFLSGFSKIKWIADRESGHRSPYTIDNAIETLRQAALAGATVEAAGILRSLYEMGALGVIRNENTAKCWRQVQLSQIPVTSC